MAIEFAQRAKGFRGDFQALKSILPFLLSHHPSCRYFHGHTFRFADHDICIGCSFFYPGVIASLAVIFLTPIGTVEPWLLIVFGVAASLFQIVRIMPWRSLTGKAFKGWPRFLMGFGFVIGLYGCLLVGDLVSKAIILYLYLNTSFLVYSAKLAHDLKTCERCPQYSLLPYCEGLKDVFRALEV